MSRLTTLTREMQWSTDMEVWALGFRHISSLLDVCAAMILR